MKRLAGILLFLALGVCPILADSTTAPQNADTVLYPKGTGAAGPAQASSGMSPMTAFLVVVLAGTGCWLLWRNKKMAKVAGINGKLAITETRSLGSKQYLVVASYGSQKFLLGVCPGTINLLTPLNEAPKAQDGQ